jgi:hypothetical protein
MTKNLRFIGLGLVGVAALLLPLNASATCGTGISFGSYYAAIVGTNPDSTSPTLRSNFWLLTAGNPLLGSGNDNGAISDTTPIAGGGPWIQQYAGTTVVLGDWGNAAFDGCADAVQPRSNQRMAFSFSDVDGSGNMIWAAACVSRIESQPQQFDLFTVAGGNIPLVPALKAAITNTVRAGTEATITVGAPDFSAGLKTDGSVGCEASAVIPQYDVYRQQTARGIAPSTTNDAAGVWVLVCTANSGQPCTFTTTGSAANSDNYLAVTPRFNGGFNTGEAATSQPARLSVRSTNVQTGPTLAVTPKAKPIPNRPVGPKKVAPGTDGQ